MQQYHIMHTLSRRVFAYSVSIIIVTATIFSTILVSVWTKTAFGDGLTQEQLSASLGNRKADLLIKMTPAVVTTETIQKGQKPTVEFRLFDSNTNQSFSHVTYYIILEKDGKRLLSDMFHDHNGDLKIQINPINTTDKAAIATTGLSGGEQDPLLGILTATQTNPITVSGPIFVRGGL